jgi:hypothetical protein
LKRPSPSSRPTRRALLAKFNKGEGGFKDRDLYVFCYEMTTGKFTAHVIHSLLGTD